MSDFLMPLDPDDEDFDADLDEELLSVAFADICARQEAKLVALTAWIINGREDAA